MRLNFAFALLLVVFIAACGGGSATSGLNAFDRGPAVGAAGDIATPLSQPDDAQLAEPLAYTESEEDARMWEILEKTPGTPGRTYDPLSIMVAFRPLAGLPDGWDSASESALAKARENAEERMVRGAPWLVEQAAAIAERYGLEIDIQIYRDGIYSTSFRAPDGADVQGIMARMRSEGGGADGQGLIARSVFEPLRHKTFTPNDPDYTATSNQSGYGPQWGHHQIRCGPAWDYTLGSPDVWVVVADTGVRISHQELSAQCFDPAVDFPAYNLNVAGSPPNDNVTDNDGHGTFIAGMVAAQGNNSRTIIGVAPECKVVPVKIANGGTTSTQRIVNGCLKGRDLARDFDKRVVVNLSWGGETGSPSEQQMVNTLFNAGVLLVVAAGNDGSNTIGSFPSQYTNCMSVGSTGFGSSNANKDRRSDFSNYGDYVDIAAPGYRLKSCRETADNAYVNQGQGTSYAAPVVAAAAALVWTLDSALTVTELRAALETTGDPTTGFSTTNPVLRLNLEKALESVSGGSVRGPQLSKVVQSGTLSLTPTISGQPDSVQCLLNGQPVQTLTAAPWDFSVDTGAISFGRAMVEFRAVKGTDVSSDSIEFIVDNTGGSFPLVEFFNPGEARVFEGVDVKGYAAGFLNALKTQAGSWSAGQVAAAGDGLWNYPVAGGHSGQGAYMGINAASAYANYDIDMLVSRRIDLAGVSNPSIVFQHKYNIQNGGSQADRARIVVSADDGATWQPAKIGGTQNNAVYSGSLLNFIQADVDLSGFSGNVHVALVFEADGSTVGETAGASGWWVDSIVVSRNYASAVPTIQDVLVTKQSVADPLPKVSSASIVGRALELESFDVDILGPNQVSGVMYWLDLPPFDNLDLYDPVVTKDGPGFRMTINVPKRKNQTALLRVFYFDANNNSGMEITKEVHLFDLRGDTDASGAVNQADLDNYAGKIGLTAGQPGYSIFLDSDLDGVITEADAAAVGYNWGKAS